jgi:membrane-bound lytic murein transglycosylase D
VLSVEPDVPDTRRMVIRVRRQQSIETFADRYDVSVAQVRAWNRTRRDAIMPGQVMVLHVPYGRAVPAEPGPVRMQTVSASSRNRGGVTKIGTSAPESKSSRGGKSAGAASAKVTKVSSKSEAKPVAPATKTATAKSKKK